MLVGSGMTVNRARICRSRLATLAAPLWCAMGLGKGTIRHARGIRWFSHYATPCGKDAERIPYD